jgi:general secretion pathway protein D
MHYLRLSLITLLFLPLSLFARCDEDRLNISLPTSIGISDLLAAVADECSLTIIYEDQDAQKTSDTKSLAVVNFIDLTLDEILVTLLNRNNLHYTIDNELLSISSLKTINIKVDYLDTMRKGNSNTDVIISGSSSSGGGASSGGASSGGGSASGQTGAYITTEEAFDFWTDLSQNLELILNRPEDKKNDTGTIVINKKSGIVTITGTHNQLKRVQEYIDQVLSALRKQVVIDVQVLSVILDNSNSTGIDWSQFSIGAAINSNFQLDAVEKVQPFAAGTGNFNASAFFNFLRTFGDTKSLSNPKILAINNQPTMISVGDNINYLVKSAVVSAGTTATTSESQTPQSLFVGVLLDITAQIDDNDYITLRINPSISEFKYSQDAVKQDGVRNLPPDTVTRRISSVVRVKDGSTVVLGGLISNTKGENEKKIPLLGDIPYLGRLFRSTDTADVVTEIVFVLQPKIVDIDTAPSLNELGFTLLSKEINNTKEAE